MTAPYSDLIPLAQAAQQLGVSRTVAYDLVLTRRLAGVFTSSRWYVTRESLEALREHYNEVSDSKSVRVQTNALTNRD